MLKIGNFILIEITIDGADFFVIANNSKDPSKSNVDRTILKKLLNKGVSLSEPQNIASIDKTKMDIQNALLAQGFYFINPEYYQQECLGCGRKINVEEAANPDRMCCGGGVITLPKWKEAEKKVLRNISVFKKK